MVPTIARPRQGTQTLPTRTLTLLECPRCGWLQEHPGNAEPKMIRCERCRMVSYPPARAGG